MIAPEMLTQDHTPIRRVLRAHLLASIGSACSRAARVLRPSVVCFAVGLLSALGCADGEEDSGSGTTLVAIVANRTDSASLRIADRYARSRDIASTHVLRLPLPRDEHISRRTFESRILEPLEEWWRQTPESERPTYLVLTRGVPHGVQGSGGFDGTRASVDSELALLPRWAAGDSIRLEGRIRNPFFGPLHEPGFPADPLAEGIVLVTRLTGFSEATALDLITRGKRASESAPPPGPPATQSGVVLLDQKSGNTNLGEHSLRMASRRIAALGQAALLDSTSRFRTHVSSPLLGYASWGSNDSSYRRRTSFSWLPGAIATTFVSSSARTFRQPPAGWHPGPSQKDEHKFGGSTQSLIADLLESGATGGIGNVYEPYLDACARPDQLFPAYLSGRNLAEAAYLSIPFLSWQTVVVGDPLCSPFSGSGSSPSSQN